MTRLLVTVSLLFLSAVTSLREATAQNLHAILVADTDSNLKDSLEIDLSNLRAVLEAGLPYGRVNIIELKGANATASRIKSTLKNLRIGKSDSVMFYFTGHGGFDEKHGHFLGLSDGPNLYRSEVIEAITSPYTPRFWAVITDACASYPKRVMAPILMPDNQTTLLTHLFLHTPGRLDITSSRPEQVSICDESQGGTFTFSLCHVLTQNAGRRLDWDDVFLMTRATTAELTNDNIGVRHYHHGILQQVQIPYSFRTMYGRDVNGLRLGIAYNGNLITSVDQGSPAAYAGLRRGMRIVGVNGDSISSGRQLNTAINFSPRQASIEVDSRWGSKSITVELDY